MEWQRALGLALTLPVWLALLALTAPSSVALPAQRLAALDRPAAMLLHNSQRRQPSDVGFRKGVSFYGLIHTEVDLSTTPLTDDLLRDSAGNYYRTVAITGATLDADLDATETTILKRAIEAGGVNLLVSSLRSTHSSTLQTLTMGEVLGSANPDDSRKDYTISDVAPEVTREFSSTRIAHDSEQFDYALTLASNALRTQVLITSTDNQARTYPLFVRYRSNAGQVFVGSETPDAWLLYNPLYENYYPVRFADGVAVTERFAQIVPMMMFVRYTAGERAWHRHRDYANLTIDDPALLESHLNYSEILPQAIAHNYHLTVAMIPGLFDRHQPEVVQLFRDHPNRFSIVQHGNNHDGYEFYKYETLPSDPHPARSIVEQEADIVEGRTRMEARSRELGLQYGAVMVFPFGISPAPTLKLLKQYNFNATVNAEAWPLGSARVREGNAHMYPAELSYSNFAVIPRWGVNPAAAFDLFIDRPVLTHNHPPYFVNGRADAFNADADWINGLHGDVEWRSLGDIVKRLYLQRRLADGSFAVMFYGNNLLITNETARDQVYHLTRQESQNVPIKSVTVDDAPVNYSIEDDLFQVDLAIPAGATRELKIRYRPADRDFALQASDVAYNPATRVVSARVRNLASEAGPVTVGFYRGPRDASDSLLDLVTAPRIEPGATAVVTTTLSSAGLTGLTVAVDPYNVIEERNEANNNAVLHLVTPYRLYVPYLVAGQ